MQLLIQQKGEPWGQGRPPWCLCPGPSVPLLGQQGSQGCILDSPGESGLVLSEEGNPAGLSSCSGALLLDQKLHEEVDALVGVALGELVPVPP